MTRWVRTLAPLTLLYLVVFAATQSSASTSSTSAVVLLPLECSELLPDNDPFLRFFEAVARGHLRNDKKLAERLYRILALRDRVDASAQAERQRNPVDLLIRKTLCFYRETREPLRMVPFDDAGFARFLKESLADLEKKVDELIFQQEYDRHQRKLFAQLLQQTEQLEEKVRAEAEVQADRNFERLSKSAKKKARAGAPQ